MSHEICIKTETQETGAWIQDLVPIAIGIRTQVRLLLTYKIFGVRDASLFIVTSTGWSLSLSNVLSAPSPD